MDKKKVSVLVAGQRFNIITDEDEKYVIDIAAKIDAKVTSISISQNMTRERAAVMTALDLADDIENDKREMAAVREQVKDYIAQIASLTAENDRIKAELSKAKLDNAALSDARAAVAAGEKERDALARQITALKEQIELMQSVEPAPAPVEESPQEEVFEEAPAEPAPGIPELPDPMPDPETAQPAEPVIEAAPADPAPQQAQVTAEDDLFFDLPEEEPVKLPRKEKKNRHDHSHVNPYKQQFMQKQEKKGYTQQRQYSLFDNEE